MLLTQTHFQSLKMESCYFNMDKMASKGNMDDITDTGIDALERLLRSNKISPESIQIYAKPKAKNVEVLFGSFKNDITDIHILKVEWSHLNSPSRLRNLASKHISLNPVQAEQIINYSALPFNHENSESRRIAARKSISNYAEHNRELKRLTRAQR